MAYEAYGREARRAAVDPPDRSGERQASRVHVVIAGGRRGQVGSDAGSRRDFFLKI